MIIKKKKEQRVKISQQTAKITPKEKEEQSHNVFGMIENMEQFRCAGTIGLFWSLWDELPTHGIIEKWSGEKRIVLPCVSGDNMDFVEYSRGCRMDEGELKVLSPANGAMVNPEEIDLLIVPGVAFDRQGIRLGRGKGFYDKFFNRSRAFKIGVGMSHQLIEEVPCEEHDGRVDAIVVPDSILSFKNSTACKSSPIKPAEARR